MKKRNIKLDKYEQGIETALGKGEFVRSPNFTATKRMFENAAKNNKNKVEDFLSLTKTLKFPSMTDSQIKRAINKGRV
ncbi:hypothetical protein COW80_01810 [Candidatus Beckwithbacteria bacterium CG22_combo_CG10-13_8_21_14_all_01_47_9]|uniref:Uncharacterized protein n=5 Tax=Candidatus Beckwithiibacteriota TaxID=1752726 RepID=A0A2H0E2L9_9BACT|nr:MAG: hypothetical protein AUJ59_02125 [Candidatus Beckwithbacteria bacterium CG1_02_47_37]PIP52192.1 MAG: hypothetical protein COX09_02870 [Candidatus Beckwithbacteria bacterium CG23_combo_of_CG06-09_8_20_14_all_47_9]PIP88169.1 MAG: hypothetical protein COW80_01810 [Candidatus Beckwithbacteria bacterium CG22_combo_CG10-13_8_21_14_all_01_47_9]PJA21977.1 MAG: hypothetical protein COX59_03535 [Candidatus Beckwithbacteria bacterium CG_4_10_14_0_2_um_filter_47_25]PJC66494.1 MAG: hypothetical prot